MSNAIKYTKKGFVRVDAACDTNSLKISVVDTGVGIEPSRVAGLFNAFTKIMRNREMNQEGVGLGLSISKNLAKALGGDISVESLLGVGSKFTVIIPLKRNKRDRKTILEQKLRDTSP
jgi:signal transduction histidine kinase